MLRRNVDSSRCLKWWGSWILENAVAHVSTVLISRPGKSMRRRSLNSSTMKGTHPRASHASISMGCMQLAQFWGQCSGALISFVKAMIAWKNIHHSPWFHDLKKISNDGEFIEICSDMRWNVYFMCRSSVVNFIVSELENSIAEIAVVSRLVVWHV